MHDRVTAFENSSHIVAREVGRNDPASGGSEQT
jgi:hypothetical protein